MAQLTLKERLKAWWEGYDVAALAKARAEMAEEEAESNATSHGAVGLGTGLDEGGPVDDESGKNWPSKRIEIVEQIWGRGFVTPGGQDHIPKLVKPFGLNPAMTVLDLGAGLGGAMRSMVKEFGVWTVGYESDPELVKGANDRSKIVDMDRQAEIKTWDPENPHFDKRYDCLFSKEAMFTVYNKQDLFEKLEPQIKPKGQLLFTDYVIEDPNNDNQVYRAWLQGEPFPTNIWSVNDYLQAMHNLNLDVRTNEDITETHRSLILSALSEFVEDLRRQRTDKDTLNMIVNEIELWARRVMALEHGGLRVYRFYAIKPGDVEM